MTQAVSLKGIGKQYRVYTNRSLREILSFGKAERSEGFWALQDINLEVERGTTLGILGRNGAGKTTLLRIISGVLQPTTGTVEVNGRLTAIFGLGSGFNPEFTGRENAMLNGLILGIDYNEMLERMDDIAAFADIGEFMDQPIKTYSSGMRSRLGFAVAVNVDPDILVLDEALSAGDAAFKKKALQRMYDLRDSGTTVLFVSHSMGMIKTFCTEAMLLHRGRLVASGEPGEVADRYREIISDAQEQEKAPTASSDRQPEYVLDPEEEEDFEEGRTSKTRPAPGDHFTWDIERMVAGVALLGWMKAISDADITRLIEMYVRAHMQPVREQSPATSGDVEIEAVQVLDVKGRPVNTVPSGSTLTVRVHLRYTRTVEDSTLGITLRRKTAGMNLFSTDTDGEGTTLGPRERGERAMVDFTFEVPLQPGNYTVSAVVSTPETEDSYAALADSAADFKITRSGRPVRGLVRLPTTVEIRGPEGERPSRSA